MRKNFNIYLVIGIGLYFISLLVDKFIIKIPDIIYIFILLASIILIIIGEVVKRKKKK